MTRDHKIRRVNVNSEEIIEIDREELAKGSSQMKNGKATEGTILPEMFKKSRFKDKKMKEELIENSFQDIT